MNSSKRFLVAGRVQGVFFRASTQERARDLRLKGWVRNLPDGRVEVFASGPVDQLQKLENWLWQGPEHAEVEQVQVLDQPVEEENPPGDFSVRREQPGQAS